MLRAVVLWLVCMVPLALSAASRLPALIEQADQVRSANPARFIQLLDQIKQLEGEATTQQHDKIAYLRAYASTYAGRCDEAVRQSNEIIAGSSDPDIKARSSALIVNRYALSRRFLEGLRELDRLTSLASKAKLDETKQHALFASANLYNQVGQYRLGLRDVDKLLSDSGDVLPRNQCFAGELKGRVEGSWSACHPTNRRPAVRGRCLPKSRWSRSFARLVIANLRNSAGDRAGAEQIARQPRHDPKDPISASHQSSEGALAEMLFADGIC